MPRFFINKDQMDQKNIVIFGDDVKHIQQVLRLRIGDCVTLCDGEGVDYEAKIEELLKDRISLTIFNTQENKNEPPIQLTLYQGIPKSDKMDFIIQKSIEIGVHAVVPVITERTVVKFGGEKDAERKVQRWQKISLEAAKQCQRGVIPKVSMPMSFMEALQDASDKELGLIPYEKETTNTLRNSLQSSLAKRIAIFIGPEGGFTQAEIEQAIKSGVDPVTLGPRILRTETAGMTTLAIVMYELGDVGK